MLHEFGRPLRVALHVGDEPPVLRLQSGISEHLAENLVDKRVTAEGETLFGTFNAKAIIPVFLYVHKP